MLRRVTVEMLAVIGCVVPVAACEASTSAGAAAQVSSPEPPGGPCKPVSSEMISTPVHGEIKPPLAKLGFGDRVPLLALALTEDCHLVLKANYDRGRLVTLDSVPPGLGGANLASEQGAFEFTVEGPRGRPFVIAALGESGDLLLLTSSTLSTNPRLMSGDSILMTETPTSILRNNGTPIDLGVIDRGQKILRGFSAHDFRLEIPPVLATRR